MKLHLDADALLTTTRAVRKRLDLDRPLDLATVRECLEIALQAPSGSNAQGWHFVLVTKADERRALGEIYRRAFSAYRDMPVSAHALAARRDGEQRAQMERVVDSAEYLAAHLDRAPALLIPCVEGRADGASGELANLAQASLYGSILPATWSFMLAARERGLGTSWTTLHLMFEREAAELLGIPYEEVTQVALTPVAYTKGTRFAPALRRPLDDVLHVERW
ncbi:MAG TPA: nitroreductase family protein [Thermoanaerobaculia bacterium]|nr:nitroreductase family protein [Thermoanaerobaculia bacterium]